MLDISAFNNRSKFPSYARLKSDFNHFLTRIGKEKEISEGKARECLTAICGINATSKADYEHKCNVQYFFKNKLQGTPCADVSNSNPFVRIHDKDDFMKWISEIIGLSPTNTKGKIGDIIYAADLSIKSNLLRSFLNNIAVNTSYSNENNCLKYFGRKRWLAKTPPRLRDAHISSYNFIHWSFPQPKKEDIFLNQSVIEKLPCRAGIVDVEQKIIFKHILDKNYNVRKPTILDAGFYEQYEPGGSTKPLKRCARLSGFDEYVHIPNIFSNVQESLFETFNT
ncbi:MAG: hypothetical protein JST75_02480 [Bacteroidetes bacterium]|nr:hypothetical protein [Bacteroidota bacterium]